VGPHFCDVIHIKSVVSSVGNGHDLDLEGP
jgi:hypothetical protein